MILESISAFEYEHLPMPDLFTPDFDEPELFHKVCIAEGRAIFRIAYSENEPRVLHFREDFYLVILQKIIGLVDALKGEKNWEEELNSSFLDAFFWNDYVFVVCETDVYKIGLEHLNVQEHVAFSCPIDFWEIYEDCVYVKLNDENSFAMLF